MSIELLKHEKPPRSSKAKATLMVIMWVPNAWFQIMHFEVCFLLNWRGPAPEAEAMGPVLLVDLRGKSPEHAVHPQGGGGFIPFGVRAAAASAILSPKNKEGLPFLTVKYPQELNTLMLR